MGRTRHRGVMRPVTTRMSPLRLFCRVGFIVRVSVLGFLALLISGIGHAVTHPAGGDSDSASGLVTSLIDGHSGDLPDIVGFSRELGYMPVRDSGAWINPGGTCSTPVPVGPEAFDRACSGHDLGYDALRLAARHDAQLGAWARFGLDARLYSDLLDTCASARCHAMATVYFGAVTVNSIRQGYRAPTTEPVLPWAGLGAAIIGVAIFGSVAEGSEVRRFAGPQRSPTAGRSEGSSRGYRSTWRPTHPAHRSESWPTSPSSGAIAWPTITRTVDTRNRLSKPNALPVPRTATGTSGTPARLASHAAPRRGGSVPQ